MTIAVRQKGEPMAKRYIDADALKLLFPDNGEGSWTYNVTAKAYIDSIPTADVVEVVRCKDCKNWEVEEDNGFYCYETCVLSGFNTTCDDYCSYGERRTDGEIR